MMMRRQFVTCARRSTTTAATTRIFTPCPLTTPRVSPLQQQKSTSVQIFSATPKNSYHTSIILQQSNNTTANNNTNNNFSSSSSSTTTTNSDNNNNENTLKLQLLKNALEQVHTYGWTIDALNHAARELNLSTMAISQLLPNAELELIEYFITKCNQHMSRTIQLMDTSNMHPKDIIKLAIRTRLELVAPYVKSGTWPEAMSSFIFGKHPLSVFSQAFYHLTSSVSSGGSSTNMSKNSITGLNAMYHLAILADEICFLTGVRDTDIEWYAKRGAVATVYASTEFFMLTDKSEGFTETWQFLNNRMEEAASLKDLTDNLFKEVSFWAKGLESMWGISSSPSNKGPVNTTTNK